jgi:hypothetical protein
VAGAAGLVLLGIAGCARVAVDPIEVKPVPIQIEHNVNIRVDRELQEFFAFERQAAQQSAATQAAVTPATMPTTQAAGVVTP